MAEWGNRPTLVLLISALVVIGSNAMPGTSRSQSADQLVAYLQVQLLHATLQDLRVAVGAGAVPLVVQPGNIAPSQPVSVRTTAIGTVC